MLAMNHMPWCALVYHELNDSRTDRQTINPSIKSSSESYSAETALKKSEGTQFSMAGHPNLNLNPAVKAGQRCVAQADRCDQGRGNKSNPLILLVKPGYSPNT